MQVSPKRILSIDVFRALTMFLMIFVNDLWTLSGIPYWLEHAKATEDFLGVADVVFPCFLFILGMAIPFAIQNRLAKGDSKGQLIKHIVIRSLALLVMGVFTVNVPELNAKATGMGVEWFQILMVLGFFLIWNVYPKSSGTKKIGFLGLQIVGCIILLYLAFIFRGGTDENLTKISPQWWGILGLIGWTYLTCALIYLFAQKHPLVLILFSVLFAILTIAGHAGWLQQIWPDGPKDWMLGNGAFHAFAMAGVTATLLLKKFQNSKQLLLSLTGMGILLLVAGFISHHFFIISKIQATPPWVFLCSGIAFILYALIYWLVDIQQKSGWFSLIKTAGTSTLTCYLIPYVYYSVADLSGISLPASLTFGLVGLAKSLLFSLLIIGITTVLGQMKIKLKI